MASQMVTVTLPRDAATLPVALARLGLSLQDVDGSFGLVQLDGDLYAVLATDEAARRVEASGSGGRFSNPMIAPLGPPEVQQGCPSASKPKRSRPRRPPK